MDDYKTTVPEKSLTGGKGRNGLVVPRDGTRKDSDGMEETKGKLK